MSSAGGLDFFSSGSLPAPLVTREEAEQIAAAQFGLAVHARLLGSQQDSNFLLVQPDSRVPGRPESSVLGRAEFTVLGVLKIANPAFTST